MVSIVSLWLPILLSAALVFVVSSIIHMVLPFHRTDLRRIPREDELLDALRRLDLPAGDYAAPHAGSMADMKDPAFLEKMKRGPIALLTVAPARSTSMGASLALWFLYSVIVGVFAAYITGRALSHGADYLTVFRLAGATAFIGYSLALLQNSIWYRRNWGTTLKSMLDGLIYGLLSAGVFGWLWPR